MDRSFCLDFLKAAKSTHAPLIYFCAHVHRALTDAALCDPDTDSGSAGGAPLSGPHSRVW